jgi:hypothetical protein
MEIDLANAGQYVSDYWTKHPALRAMAAAFLVGAIGSAAYLAALLFGYLGDQAIDQLGSKFQTAKGTPAVKQLSGRRLAIFTFFGGGIALVFQWAQGAIFAPIQALVLGATWPTIISQWIAKGTEETNKERIDQVAGDFRVKDAPALGAPALGAPAPGAPAPGAPAPGAPAPGAPAPGAPAPGAPAPCAPAPGAPTQ